jgi:hypothetical protein
MEKKKRGLFWLVTALFLTELGIVFLAVPHSWVMTVGSYDRGFVYQWFGEGFEEKVLSDAVEWFNATFTNTGIQEATYDFLVGQWNATGKVQIDDRGLKSLTEDRLDTVWAAMSVAFYRLSETSKWVVYMAPLLFAILIDGFAQREINKWRFFMPSPMVHYASRMAIITGFSLIVLIPFAPIPLYAPLLPVLIAIMGVFVWVAVTNLSKRL